MIKENAGSSEGSAAPASMIVVQNWLEELKASCRLNVEISEFRFQTSDWGFKTEQSRNRQISNQSEL
jgi:hypothetical protein